MADPKQVKLLRSNITEWNTRMDGGNLRPNLKNAELQGAHLEGANLCGADLRGTYLMGAELSDCYLHGADLSNAHLHGAYLINANLSEATLILADLTRTELSNADLTRADLRLANLTNAVLVDTKLNKAILSGCRVYGISAWNTELKGTIQSGLVITRRDEPAITVDDIEIAQFVYLLLENKTVRKIFDTITSKVVLILGCFIQERKKVLDALRDELRKRDYTPIIFDFEKPSTRDLTETVSTLAHMARFVIADITDAKSIPQELQKIIPNLPSLPVQPIILEDKYEYSMFKDFG